MRFGCRLQLRKTCNFVHDDIWARTLFLSQGDVDVALVSVDLVGFFWGDVELLRERLATQLPELDHLIIEYTRAFWTGCLGAMGTDPWSAGRNDRYQGATLQHYCERDSSAWDSQRRGDHVRGVHRHQYPYSPEKGSRSFTTYVIRRLLIRSWALPILPHPTGDTIATMVQLKSSRSLNGSSLGISPTLPMQHDVVWKMVSSIQTKRFQVSVVFACMYLRPLVA